MIEMIATREFQHDGRDVSAGEHLRVSPIEAAALKYQGRAKFAEPRDAGPTERAVITPAPSASAPDKPKRRRRSKRRDISPQITK